MKTRLPLPGQLKLENKGINAEIYYKYFYTIDLGNVIANLIKTGPFVC